MVDFQSRDTRRGRSDDEAETRTGDERDEQSNGSSSDPATAKPDEQPRSVETGVFVLRIGDGADEMAADPVAVVIDALDGDGRTVAGQDTVESGFDAVQTAIDRVVSRRDVDVVLTVGGTGVGPSDVTVEAIEPLCEKAMPGFGELFRVSYHEQVGPEVISMRPTAGIIDDVPVFCVPGEADAARFTVSEIVLETLDGLLEDVADPS
ncbi:molybdenum cofactor biosynthesis protein [Halorhabdus sp. CBA1104]|uniref:MogA/MoaB family molybdenum cofactor biosynthesis protein n=1 Tax=Halorhabdus sp. CBA1104 TaxID=1380432 RepID=UPI0012B20180|nr:molybdopterin-binding protein [Halorhabdus sp. CBA1104]QGN06783.1 molybdenum cofactor biosynthesis protein [Halorhabdus sp. CBA1104]